MAVTEIAPRAKRKPLTKRWWLWAIVGIILLFWLDACADKQLEKLEAETQQEARTLVDVHPRDAAGKSPTPLRMST